MADAPCEYCVEHLVMWHEKKTDYENAARKIRKLKSIIRDQKIQLEQFKRMDKKKRKQLKKLNELLEMQDALLTFFAQNWLPAWIFHTFYLG